MGDGARGAPPLFVMAIEFCHVKYEKCPLLLKFL